MYVVVIVVIIHRHLERQQQRSMNALFDDVDADTGRQSKRRVTAGTYIPMLTELGQFRSSTPSLIYKLW